MYRVADNWWTSNDGGVTEYLYPRYGKKWRNCPRKLNDNSTHCNVWLGSTYLWRVSWNSVDGTASFAKRHNLQPRLDNKKVDFWIALAFHLHHLKYKLCKLYESIWHFVDMIKEVVFDRMEPTCVKGLGWQIHHWCRKALATTVQVPSNVNFFFLRVNK